MLDSDPLAGSLYRSRGYDAVDRTFQFRCGLDGFRPAIDRVQMQLRRRMAVEEIVDAPPRSFWEAVTTAGFDLTRFEVMPRGNPSPRASVTYRDMPGDSGRGMGVIDVRVDPSHRRQGLATFALGESFRQLARAGVASVEMLATEKNPATVRLCRKLGMKEIARGTVFRKTVGA